MGAAKILGGASVALSAPLLVPGLVGRAAGIGDDDARRRWLRIVGAREAAAAAGLLGASDRKGWLRARAVGDAMDLLLLAAVWRAGPGDRARLALTTATVVAIGVVDGLAAAGRLSP